MKYVNLIPVFVIACFVASAFQPATGASSMIQLGNDNGVIGLGSYAGRTPGDIDAVVISPPPELFPLTIHSVNFLLHRPQGAPNLTTEASVQVHIYAMVDGRPGEMLGSSDVRNVSAIDEWLSLPLTSPVTIETVGSFVAAVEWHSGTFRAGAPAVATDTNADAPQAEKDAKNLYHDGTALSLPQCRDGFCHHSQFWANAQDVGFNMIRVTVTANLEPTSTPTATATGVSPTSTPSRAPATIYLPMVLKNAIPRAQSFTLGNAPGDGISFSVTSGDGVVNQCWNDPEYSLWVGHESPQERGIMRSVLAFDLSRLPANAQILWAQLQLFLIEAGGDPSPIRVSVHAVTYPWAHCASWNDLARAVGTEYTSIQVDTAISAYTIDVTRLVQAWHQGTLPNYGLILRGPEQGPAALRGFTPVNSPQEDLRPRIIISYLNP